MVRNQVYCLDKDPECRLIFWRRVFSREDGSAHYYFVKAPSPGEKFGIPIGKWVFPDPARIFIIRTDIVKTPEIGVGDIVRLTEARGHERVKLIPGILPEYTKPNLP